MTWRKRVGLEPPPNFWADFLANVSVVFPRAVLSDSELRKIYTLVVDEWREGVALHSIVRQLCSCDDGVNVSASPGALARLGRHRGVARAPIGAARGEVFDLGRVRDSKAVGDALARLHLVAARIRAVQSGKSPEANKLDSLVLEHQQLRIRLEELQRSAFWVAPSTAETVEVEQPTRPPRKKNTEPANAPREEQPARPPRKKTTVSAKPPKATATIPPPGPPEEGLGLDDDISDELMRALADRVVPK